MVFGPLHTFCLIYAERKFGVNMFVKQCKVFIHPFLGKFTQVCEMQEISQQGRCAHLKFWFLIIIVCDIEQSELYTTSKLKLLAS